MGYMVTALAAIGEDDYHSLFLTYIPSHGRVATEWVNDWIYAKFSSLAATLGPDAVLIAPANRYGDRDFQGLRGIFRGSDRTTGFIHAGYPLLVVSCSPMRASAVDRDVNAIVINLAAFRDDAGLAGLFDQLAEQSRNHADDVRSLRLDVPDVDLTPQHDDTGGWGYLFNLAVQLKPNMFGVGLDLNEIATFLSSRHRRVAARAEVVIPMHDAHELEGDGQPSLE